MDRHKDTFLQLPIVNPSKEAGNYQLKCVVGEYNCALHYCQL
jgi:hypothetical protein